MYIKAIKLLTCFLDHTVFQCKFITNACFNACQWLLNKYVSFYLLDWETEDETDDEDGEEDDDDDDDEEGDSSDEDSGEETEDYEFEEEDEEGDTETCPICLNRLRDQDVGTPESCDHVFCLDCIQEWAKVRNMEDEWQNKAFFSSSCLNHGVTQ